MHVFGDEKEYRTGRALGGIPSGFALTLGFALVIVVAAGCGEAAVPDRVDADAFDDVGGDGTADVDDPSGSDGASGDQHDGDANDEGLVDGHAWRAFEATLDLEVPEGNPFDPAEIAVDATFTSPDGAVFTVPAFVYRDFSRELVAGENPREKLTANGGLSWRVRFRPPFGSVDGAWTWQWRAKTVAGEEVSEVMTFAAEKDLDGRGLLEASPRDHRYLVFEDGTPWFAIGENMAWADRRGTYAYDGWLDRLVSQGGNYIRIWMPSWGFGLEWIERDSAGVFVSSSLGNYTARLDRAWQLDQVLEAAHRHGVQVMLCIQNHGPFSTIHAGQWESNPFNVANGGPLASPTDFFTDEAARALFKRRLRYIIGRWGYMPNILAWELWNEVDLVADPSSAEVKAWHTEMATEIRRLDPWGHLVTTSIGGLEVYIGWMTDDIASLTGRFDFWSLPDLDLTQLHFYGIGDKRLDFSSDPARIMTHLKPFSKPMLIAEIGVDPFGASETLAADPEGVAFHDGLWIGLFAEGFGTGMSWWWDNIVDPQDYYGQFQPVATITAGVRFDREGFVASMFEDADIRVHRLEGRTTVIGWVKHVAHQWHAPNHEVVSGATVDLGDIDPGTWQITWIDTWATQPAEISTVAHAGGRLVLTVPDFSRDLAFSVVQSRL